MSLAALGAIAGGLNQGLDLAQRDQELRDQRAFREEDRTFKKLQQDDLLGRQKRENEAAARQDQLRTDLQGVTRAGDYNYGASDVGPTKTMQTASGEARQQATAYQKAGDDKTARELFRWANDADMKAASQRYQSAIQGLPSTASPYEFAQAVAPHVDGDQSPVGIRNITKNDDGSVSLEAYNKTNGYTTQHTFKDVKSMQDALTAHYSPDLYSDMVKRRLAAQEKISEEQAKGHVLPAGGQFVPGVGDPRKPVANDNGLVWTGQYNPDGSPQMVKPMRDGSSSGAAAGAGGKGGAVDNTLKPYADAFKFSSTEGESKLTPEQLRVGSGYLPALASQGIDPMVASRIAGDAAVDPTKTRLELNHVTGEVDRIYRNPDVNKGNSIILARGAGSIKDIEKQVGGPEKMRDVASGMVASIVGQAPEEQRGAVQTQLIKVASDPTLRKQYLAAAGQAGKDVGAISRQLDIIGTYMKPQAAPAQQGQAAPVARPVIKNPGGMYQADPSSPAGKAMARRQQYQAEKAEAEKASIESQRLLSKQFNADKASMDPLEFARKYDSMRMKLPSSDAAELQRIERSIR